RHEKSPSNQQQQPPQDKAKVEQKGASSKQYYSVLPPAKQGGYKEPPVEQSPAERQRELRLEVGDVLIFEEVLGPRTGEAADADPVHRHAVRLTKVQPGVDTLFDLPILEIEWAREDAL